MQKKTVAKNAIKKILHRCDSSWISTSHEVANHTEPWTTVLKITEMKTANFLRINSAVLESKKGSGHRPGSKCDYLAEWGINCANVTCSDVIDSIRPRCHSYAQALHAVAMRTWCACDALSAVTAHCLKFSTRMCDVNSASHCQFCAALIVKMLLLDSI